jgi:hypothetical protein
MRLEQLNSFSKYPSIPTWHAKDHRGRLSPELTAAPWPADDYVATEKIDGTNARILVRPNDYLIGSREAWLTAYGDRVPNQLPIGHVVVNALRAIAERVTHERTIPTHGVVLFLEVYGGTDKVLPCKSYGDDVGARLFDVMVFAKDEPAPATTPAELAAWRDNGGQRFLNETELHAWASEWGVPLVPRCPCPIPPVEHDAAVAFIEETVCVLTMENRIVARQGPAEGVVVRSRDRARIAKLRTEDYARTLRGK